MQNEDCQIIFSGTYDDCFVMSAILHGDYSEGGVAFLGWTCKDHLYENITGPFGTQ